MENNPNQIPEEVLKGMQEDAGRFVCKKYPHILIHGKCIYDFSKDYIPTLISCDFHTYLQGRQDEWERQREEIDRLKGLIGGLWQSQYNGDLLEYEDYWIDFKTKHNL